MVPGKYLVFPTALVLFLATWVHSGQESGQLYTSLTAMNDLFEFDHRVGELLSESPEWSPEMERYMELYTWALNDRSSKEDFLDMVVTSHPLHIYALMKRLVLLWPKILLKLKSYKNQEEACSIPEDQRCQSWAERGECEINTAWMRKNCPHSCSVCASPEFLEKLKQVLDTHNPAVLPSDSDLRGSATALSRLRYIYKLHIKDMVQGRLLHTKTSVRLTVFDCMKIASSSFAVNDLTSAWLWYRHSRRMTSDLDLIGHIESLMEPVGKQHDETWGPNLYTTHFPSKVSDAPEQLPWDSEYAELCRGKSYLTPDEASRLHCHVNARGNPYLILQPVKYEELHYDPELYLFYDVVSDVEIQAIQSTAMSRLSRSHVLSKEKYSEIRVSQTAWLSNNTHPFLPAINRRIAAVTGLHVYEGPPHQRGGEQLQVLSYGVGGHYNYHMDLFYKIYPTGQWNATRANSDVFISGDRLATWMFYLSDVEAGGRTAFPQAGVSVAPVKGSAVMWFNLKKNGDCNWRSQHGGCPVVLGHKWAANKWILEHINFLNRRCSLNAEE